MNDWRDNIVTRDAEVQAIAAAARTIAVLGIKTEEQSDQPAFYVARYLADAGIKVIPVPVYYPDVTEILGTRVYRRIVDVPGPIDIVDVFRRGPDVAKHTEDLLASKPACVWLQLGITNDEVSETLARAGIRFVQSRCLMVEHRAGVAATRSGPQSLPTP